MKYMILQAPIACVSEKATFKPQIIMPDVMISGNKEHCLRKPCSLCFINCFRLYQTTNGKTFLYMWVQVGAIVRERERASKRRSSFHIILHVLIILFCFQNLVFANKFHVKRGQLSSFKPKKTISAHTCIPEKINSAKCPAETCNNKVVIEAQKCLTVYIYLNL